jgi:hypothetical protein
MNVAYGQENKYYFYVNVAYEQEKYYLYVNVANGQEKFYYYVNVNVAYM